MYDAAMGLILLLNIVLVVREYPPEGSLSYRNEHNELQKMGWLSSMRRAYGRKQNWFCGVYTDLMNLPIFLLGGLWGGLYLTQIEGMPRDVATHISGMLFLGTIIGSPLAGFISDKLSRRKLPMILGAITSFIFIAMLVYMHLNATDLSILFFLLISCLNETFTIHEV